MLLVHRYRSGACQEPGPCQYSCGISQKEPEGCGRSDVHIGQPVELLIRSSVIPMGCRMHVQGPERGRVLLEWRCPAKSGYITAIGSMRVRPVKIISPQIRCAILGGPRLTDLSRGATRPGRDSRHRACTLPRRRRWHAPSSHRRLARVGEGNPSPCVWLVGAQLIDCAAESVISILISLLNGRSTSARRLKLTNITG